MMRGRITHWLQGRGFRDVIIGLPYIWLLLFFFIPFLLVLAISFGSRTPTAPPFGYGGDHPWISFAGYARLFHDDLYIRAFLVSLSNAATATVLCLALGYPMSLALTRVSASWRNILLMLVILPFWTSFLLRVYAWMGLMGKNSWFNALLTDAYNWLTPAGWHLNNIPMMHSNFAALLLSLKIAVTSATAATILGTMAGITLARFRRFKGRTLFSGLVTAPLIMPEVITGISSLMMFILMAKFLGWPGARGFTTVTLAHITFSMVFVTTIIQSRMLQADRAIEEAAMDLGSKPWAVLFDVTLPVIFPAILSGWLLAFTISLDDVVITSFTTGPGNTTLPLLIWSKVKLGVTPDINALATLTVVVVGCGVALAGYLLNRSEKRREADARLAYRAND